MLEAKKQKDREEFIKNNPYVPNKPINKDKFFNNFKIFCINNSSK